MHFWSASSPPVHLLDSGHDVRSVVTTDVVPESVRDLVAARLKPLGPSVRTTLSLAAIVGMHFTYAILEAVLGRRVADDLDAAVDAHLCVEEPGRSDGYWFVHQLVQDSLLADLTRRRKAELHGAVGRAITELGDPDAVAASAARHFGRAGPGFFAEWASWSRRAADSARRQFAFEDAAQGYEDSEISARFAR